MPETLSYSKWQPSPVHSNYLWSSLYVYQLQSVILRVLWHTHTHTAALHAIHQRMGQHARRWGWPLVLLRCLSAETEREPRKEARGVEGEEKESGREATDCQIAVWQSSVASGTVTTATTAASVVVAVRWRQDREKQRKTREGRVMEDRASDWEDSQNILFK